MHTELATSPLALRATTAHVLGARPDAPVVADHVRPERLRRSRRAAAAALRGVAGWVEPRRTCSGAAVPTH